MAAYRRAYDSRHLQADCQEPGSAPEPYTLGNRVWATFTFLWCIRSSVICTIVLYRNVSSYIIWSRSWVFSAAECLPLVVENKPWTLSDRRNSRLPRSCSAVPSVACNCRVLWDRRSSSTGSTDDRSSQIVFRTSTCSRIHPASISERNRMYFAIRYDFKTQYAKWNHPRTGISFGTLRSAMEYGLSLPFSVDYRDISYYFVWMENFRTPAAVDPNSPVTKEARGDGRYDQLARFSGPDSAGGRRGGPSWIKAEPN